eukprot:30395-Pelagococcus_subviridis.AAC.2
MNTGDTSVAMSSAHTHATYGVSPNNPSSNASLAMTNPSSPRPTMAQPTTAASPTSRTNAPVASFPSTAGTAYPIPSPAPAPSNRSASGICIPTERKKIDASRALRRSYFAHASFAFGAAANAYPPTNAPNKYVDPAAPHATTRPSVSVSIDATTTSSRFIFVKVSPARVAHPHSRAKTRGTTRAAPAPTTTNATETITGRPIAHVNAPASSLDPPTFPNTARITRDSTSSIIAATHTREPMRVCNAFAAAIVFVAIPMDVDDSAVPAATPTAGEYPAAVMNAHPSAIGRSVPVTAMAIATGPTCARASTSMESPPVITRTHRPRFPRRTTPSGSGMKFAPEGPRRRPTTISPTSGAWTSSPSLPPHASAMNVIQSRAISYSVEAIAVPSDSSRHGGGVPSAVVLPVGFSSRPRVDRSAAARAATRRRRRPRARVWLEARSRSRAVRRVVVLSRRGTLHVRGAFLKFSSSSLSFHFFSPPPRFVSFPVSSVRHPVALASRDGLIVLFIIVLCSFHRRSSSRDTRNVRGTAVRQRLHRARQRRHPLLQRQNRPPLRLHELVHVFHARERVHPESLVRDALVSVRIRRDDVRKRSLELLRDEADLAFRREIFLRVRLRLKREGHRSKRARRL